jgi:hypothetical protein
MSLCSSLRPASRDNVASMTFNNWRHGLVIGAWIAIGMGAQAQHFHVDAGAPSTAAGTPLYFINGPTYNAESGFVFNMALRSNDVVAGLYEGGPTFTAVSSDGFDGPPAAPGAQLALVIKAVSGPQGGNWSFWESPDCDQSAETIAFTMQTGSTNGTQRFLLSQNAGLPGEDPFGHCHGRRFTVDKLGLYTVWAQILDVSRNGPGSGPIHTPSAIYSFYFNAGLNIARLTNASNVVNATFGTRSGSRFYLEANSVLDGTLPWETVAGPATGNNRLQTLLHPHGGSEAQGFYRLRITTP